MKLKISVVLLLVFCSLFVVAQTKEQILKYKIYRVDKSWKAGKAPRMISTYYDMNANIIKEVKSYGSKGDTSVAIYKYLDNELIETNEQGFDKTALTSMTDTSYTYVDGRLLSKTTKDLESEVTADSSAIQLSDDTGISKEDYHYNDKGQIDTVLVSNNDTTIWTTKNPFAGDKKHKATLSLKKVQIYTYPDGNTVSIKECRFPIDESDNTCCNISQTIENDSLEIYTQTYHERQGCIVSSAESIDSTIYHKKNGLIYMYQMPAWDGSKTYCTYIMDEKGLIQEGRSITVFGKRSSSGITRYKYYYRK